MSKKSASRSILKEKLREIKKLEKEIEKESITSKLSCITDIFIKNKMLCDTIVSLPSDEVKIVLSEALNSTEFINSVNNSLSKSEKLCELRERKSAKAEKRKAVKGDKNQPTSTSFDTSEQFALSEQAEMSEQTMKLDYTGDISNN